MARETRGPEFIRFIKPVIESLKELGGSGRASEVVDLVIEKMGITDDELDVTTKTGIPRIKNQIHWARMYLVKGDMIDSSQRGVWTLTEEGQSADFGTHAKVHQFFKEVAKAFRQDKADKDDTTSDTEEDPSEESEPDDSGLDYKDKLLNILKSLPPAGFERLCQRLLREAGFKKVVVLGKSGDGGIDGEGILEINPLMSFKVLFQSKRYEGSVSSPQIRDFRGAMQGRADKGIIITTGRFTQDAKREAIRDGAPPIELVDGDALVELFESNQLGLRPVKAFEIVDDFFDEYRSDPS